MKAITRLPHFPLWTSPSELPATAGLKSPEAGDRVKHNVESQTQFFDFPMGKFTVTYLITGGKGYFTSPSPLLRGK